MTTEAAPAMSTPCCKRMAEDLSQRCDQHPNRFDCPDNLIAIWKGRHHILIHDGGESGVKINFCPWCGKNLKPKSSKRRRRKDEIKTKLNPPRP
jgi:hypothetical protein